MSMIGTLQQPHHRGNTLLPYNHLHHLFPVHDQVILLNGLHQYTTQILNDCGTIQAIDCVFSLDTSDNRLKNIYFLGHFFFRVGNLTFVGVQVKEQLEDVGHCHVIGMVDHLSEHFRVAVHTLDGLLLSVVHQAQAHPEHIPCQHGQDVMTTQAREHGVEVLDVALCGVLEEGVQDAGGLRLDHLDGQQGQLVLPIFRVIGIGWCGDIFNGLAHKGRRGAHIVEQFTIESFELRDELTIEEEFIQAGFLINQGIKLLDSRFSIPSSTHLEISKYQGQYKYIHLFFYSYLLYIIMLSHCQEHAAIGQNRIIVSVRVRPFNEKESGLVSVVAVDQSHQEVTMKPMIETSPTCEKIFTFDHVYGPETSKQEITHTLDPMIKDVFLGINGCVLGYGITGSGVNDVMNELIASGAGKIFQQLEQQPKFTMKVSYYMILFEKIHDLLDAEPLSKQIKIREKKQNMKHKIVLEGGIELPISNMEEFANIWESGRKKRDIIITNMSLMSSRINQVMMINIYIKEEEEEVQVGKLNFVRCMGCQRIKKTGLLEKSNEISKVGSTLGALSNVLVALSKGTKFVPYRDSSLTRILQPSLKNIMLIGNIAPSEIHYEQSLATLRFCDHLYKNSNKKAP